MVKFDEQLKRLETMWSTMNADYVTQSEFEEGVKTLVQLMQQVGEKLSKDVTTAKNDLTGENTKAYKEAQKAYTQWKRDMEALNASFAGQIDARTDLLKQDVENSLQGFREALKAIQLLPGPKGDSITGDPGLPGKDGSPDTPDQVIDKVNASEKLINADRVEGIRDIERIAKANATFNPAMGPSFSDLKRLQDQITGIGGTTQGGKVSINYIIDGGGSVLTTGVKGFVEIPYNMTVTGWEIFGDQSGSVLVDVWRSTYAAFPPLVGNSIAGSEKPTLSSAQSNKNTSLSTWTTALLAGDVLAYNIDSAATVTRITIALLGTKS